MNGAKRVPRVQDIRIDWVGPSANQLFGRGHWSKRNKIKKSAYLAARVGALAAKSRRVDYPVDLFFKAFIARSGRLYDTSNYSLTGKMLEDGLVRAGILPDDNQKWVKFVGWYPAAWTDESQSFINLKMVEVLL